MAAEGTCYLRFGFCLQCALQHQLAAEAVLLRVFNALTVDETHLCFDAAVA
jgi:hypothetical protein